MKSMIIAVILGVLFFTSFCFAVEENVTVMWDYENPPTDLAGFDLRVNEDNSTMIGIGPDQRTWAGTLDLLDSENVFEVRAKDLGGQVSGWASERYDPIPGDPRITIIIVQP